MNVGKTRFCDCCGELAVKTAKVNSKPYYLCESCAKWSENPFALEFKRKNLQESKESAKACQTVLENNSSGPLCARFVKTFVEEFESNTESYRKVGFHLLSRYAEASPEVRMAIENVFIDLCGWSFHTLLVKARLLDDTEGICDGSKADLTPSSEEMEEDE